MLTDERRVATVERLFHLRRAAVFGTLAPRLLAIVAEASRPRVFRAGEALVLEGVGVDAARFVIEGRLHLQRGGRTVGHGGVGTALGEIGVVARAPAVVTATAETDTLALELHADAVQDLLEDHFEILRHLLREICGRVIDDWQRLPAGTPPLIARPPAPRAASPLRDLDLVERILKLRQFVPFDRASINALAELARSLSEVHFAPGEPLWSEGEPARHVLLVVAGEARLSAENGFGFDGPPGAALGALETIAGRARWYDARAKTPLTGLTGAIDVMFDVFEDNLDMAQGFLTAMSRWSLLLTEKLADRDPGENGGASSLDVSRVDTSDAAEPPEAGAAG